MPDRATTDLALAAVALDDEQIPHFQAPTLQFLWGKLVPLQVSYIGPAPLHVGHPKVREVMPHRGTQWRLLDSALRRAELVDRLKTPCRTCGAGAKPTVHAELHHRLLQRINAVRGSGKTTSLIKALDWVMSEHGASMRAKKQKVACITYTDLAANEILADVNDDPLVHVSTIHSFYWSIAKTFQADIKVWLQNDIRRRISELEEAVKAGNEFAAMNLLREFSPRLAPARAADRARAQDGDENTWSRTLRLLYVCCTRTRRGLVLTFFVADPATIVENVVASGILPRSGVFTEDVLTALPRDAA